MKSIEFPQMFNSNSTRIKTDLKATRQNLLLLLHCEKGEMFGDPYFGIRLKKYIFEQNNYILRDIIIDEIYTQLALFMPQLTVERKNIKIVQTAKATLVCTFKAVNKVDFTTNIYSLVLYDEDNT